MNFTELPFGTRGRIFRSCMPFSRNYDPEGLVLVAAQEATVSVVVMLASDEECARKSSKTTLRGEYERLGWVVVPCSIPDFGIPRAPRAFAADVHTVVAHARDGRGVLVHCHAGIGRTGTFLACLKRVLEPALDAETAITWVRSCVPKAVATRVQKKFVRAFEIAQ